MAAEAHKLGSEADRLSIERALQTQRMVTEAQQALQGHVQATQQAQAEAAQQAVDVHAMAEGLEERWKGHQLELQERWEAHMSARQRSVVGFGTEA